MTDSTPSTTLLQRDIIAGLLDLKERVEVLERDCGRFRSIEAAARVVTARKRGREWTAITALREALR